MSNNSTSPAAAEGRTVNIAIVGLGNCATSLVEGLEFYKNAAPDAEIPGLMHTVFGDYHVADVHVVAAIAVVAATGCKDGASALYSGQNQTIYIADISLLVVEVKRALSLVS